MSFAIEQARFVAWLRDLNSHRRHHTQNLSAASKENNTTKNTSAAGSVAAPIVPMPLLSPPLASLSSTPTSTSAAKIAAPPQARAHRDMPFSALSVVLVTCLLYHLVTMLVVVDALSLLGSGDRASGTSNAATSTAFSREDGCLSAYDFNWQTPHTALVFRHGEKTDRRGMPNRDTITCVGGKCHNLNTQRPITCVSTLPDSNSDLYSSFASASHAASSSDIVGEQSEPMWRCIEEGDGVNLVSVHVQCQEASRKRPSHCKRKGSCSLDVIVGDVVSASEIAARGQSTSALFKNAVYLETAPSDHGTTDGNVATATATTAATDKHDNTYERANDEDDGEFYTGDILPVSPSRQEYMYPSYVETTLKDVSSSGSDDSNDGNNNINNNNKKNTPPKKHGMVPLVASQQFDLRQYSSSLYWSDAEIANSYGDGLTTFAFVRSVLQRTWNRIFWTLPQPLGSLFLLVGLSVLLSWVFRSIGLCLLCRSTHSSNNNNAYSDITDKNGAPLSASALSPEDTIGAEEGHTSRQQQQHGKWHYAGAISDDATREDYHANKVNATTMSAVSPASPAAIERKLRLGSNRQAEVTSDSKSNNYTNNKNSATSPSSPADEDESKMSPSSLFKDASAESSYNTGPTHAARRRKVSPANAGVYVDQISEIDSSSSSSVGVMSQDKSPILHERSPFVVRRVSPHKSPSPATRLTTPAAVRGDTAATNNNSSNGSGSSTALVGTPAIVSASKFGHTPMHMASLSSSSAFTPVPTSASASTTPRSAVVGLRVPPSSRSSNMMANQPFDTFVWQQQQQQQQPPLLMTQRQQPSLYASPQVSLAHGLQLHLPYQDSMRFQSQMYASPLAHATFTSVPGTPSLILPLPGSMMLPPHGSHRSSHAPAPASFASVRPHRGF